MGGGIFLASHAIAASLDWNENKNAGMARIIIIMKTTSVRQCIKFENLFFNLTVINHVASVYVSVFIRYAPHFSVSANRLFLFSLHLFPS